MRGCRLCQARPSVKNLLWSTNKHSFRRGSLCSEYGQKYKTGPCLGSSTWGCTAKLHTYQQMVFYGLFSIRRFMTWAHTSYVCIQTLEFMPPHEITQVIFADHPRLWWNHWVSAFNTFWMAFSPSMGVLCLCSSTSPIGLEPEFGKFWYLDQLSCCRVNLVDLNLIQNRLNSLLHCKPGWLIQLTFSMTSQNHVSQLHRFDYLKCLNL